MKFNDVEITQETTQTTRQWFAENARACVGEVLSGEVILPAHVDFEEYKSQREKYARSALAGEFDHTFTFMQRAYYIQTGESVALLP